MHTTSRILFRANLKRPNEEDSSRRKMTVIQIEKEKLFGLYINSLQAADLFVKNFFLHFSSTVFFRYSTPVFKIDFYQ